MTRKRRVACRAAWLAGLLCVSAPAARAEDVAAEHVSRANALMQSEEYAAALKELEAAYAQKQSPRLLLQMAQAQQRLGHGREALDLYRRFLVAEPDTDAATRADVEGRIARLGRAMGGPAFSPALPGAPGAPGGAVASGPSPLAGDVRMVPVRLETRPHYGLMSAGISLLSTGYAAAFITGTIFAAASSSNTTTGRRERIAGGTLIIPVIGPIISGIYLPAAGQRDAVYFWSLPWILADGTVQVAGLVMTVIGAKLRRTVPVLNPISQRLRLAPYSTLGGGGLTLSGNF